MFELCLLKDSKFQVTISRSEGLCETRIAISLCLNLTRYSSQSEALMNSESNKK